MTKIILAILFVSIVGKNASAAESPFYDVSLLFTDRSFSVSGFPQRISSFRELSLFAARRLGDFHQEYYFVEPSGNHRKLFSQMIYNRDEIQRIEIFGDNALVGMNDRMYEAPTYTVQIPKDGSQLKDGLTPSGSYVDYGNPDSYSRCKPLNAMNRFSNASLNESKTILKQSLLCIVKEVVQGITYTKIVAQDLVLTNVKSWTSLAVIKNIQSLPIWIDDSNLIFIQDNVIKIFHSQNLESEKIFDFASVCPSSNSYDLQGFQREKGGKLVVVGRTSCGDHILQFDSANKLLSNDFLELPKENVVYSMWSNNENGYLIKRTLFDPKPRKQILDIFDLKNRSIEKSYELKVQGRNEFLSRGYMVSTRLDKNYAPVALEITDLVTQTVAHEYKLCDGISSSNLDYFFKPLAVDPSYPSSSVYAAVNFTPYCDGEWKDILVMAPQHFR